ncbi:MAG: hypothetical protein CL878_13415, partial [Dehalococcoidia bacterium]|nr:hypothetical protein [Dehalococcoidia bacterium]
MAPRSRRQYLGGATSLGASLLATACDALSSGSDVAPTAAPETLPAISRRPGVPSQTKPQVPVRVRFIPDGSYGGTPMADQFRQYMTPFTEAHPHIALDWQDWGYDAFMAAINEAIAAGPAGESMQDVVHLPWWQVDYVPQLVVRGALLGLDPFIRRDRYDLTDFWPGCLERSTWRGDLYALPTHVDTQLVFYNLKLFTAAGVPAPPSDWTWQHLLEAARQLTHLQGATSVYGFALSHAYGWPLGAGLEVAYDYPATIPWIWGNGGDVVSADLTRSLVDQPQAQEALEWLVAQRETHAVWPPAAGPSAEALFKAGQLAMLYGPRSFTGDLLVSQPGFAYGLAAAPRGPVTSANWLFSQSAFHIGAATSVPDEAWTFLSWWAGEAAQRDFQHGTARKGAKLTLPSMAPPARRSVAQEVAPWFGEPIVAALEHA